jgi:hypothetical protein
MSPFIGNFIAASGASWRWIYAMGCIYNASVVIMIAFWGRETLFNLEEIPANDYHNTWQMHFQTLFGLRRANASRDRWSSILLRPILLQIRPIMMLMSLYIALIFAWVVGIKYSFCMF